VDDTLETLRDEAMRAVARVLRAADAKPETLLRAAEVILRQAPDAPSTAPIASRLTDRELLALARGEEGGTPPKRGPRDSSAGAVPSATSEVDPPGLVTPTRVAEGPKRAAPDVSREPPKGTQRGPAKRKPAGGTQKGPAKCDPPGLALPKRGKMKLKVDRQISVNDTPEPWE
jgi:hypothetical protein